MSEPLSAKNLYNLYDRIQYIVCIREEKKKQPTDDASYARAMYGKELAQTRTRTRSPEEQFSAQKNIAQEITNTRKKTSLDSFFEEFKGLNSHKKIYAGIVSQIGILHNNQEETSREQNGLLIIYGFKGPQQEWVYVFSKPHNAQQSLLGPPQLSEEQKATLLAQNIEKIQSTYQVPVQVYGKKSNFLYNKANTRLSREPISSNL